jgi:hypothetical protein
VAAARSRSRKPAHRTYVLDTSVLLSDPHALVRFDEHEVVIPVVVVTELEAKRTHPELGYFARSALRLLDDMLETMYEAPGIGLAAIQVGVPLRVVTIDIGEPEEVGSGDAAIETETTVEGRREAREKRKPKPMGNVLHCGADAMTKILYILVLQEGKDRPAHLPPCGRWGVPRTVAVPSSVK